MSTYFNYLKFTDNESLVFNPPLDYTISSGTSYSNYATTQNFVDLTGLNNLDIVVETLSAKGGSAYPIVNIKNASGSLLGSTTIKSATSVSMDVSGINERVNIEIRYVFARTQGGTGNCNITITKLLAIV